MMNNMNQMMMGNMNQMGMNPQMMTNFGMDDTAMKIRAIIDPYEKKMIDLEKTIRQKDFEILVLKEKLSKYETKQMGMGMSNQMGMNMNNQMGMNMNNQMGMNMNNQMGMNMNNQMGMNMNNQIGINNQMGMNMNNQMNPMNMNNNWMNGYLGNNNNMNFPFLNNINPINEIKKNNSSQINLIFHFDKMIHNELCSFNEKFIDVSKRVCKKLGKNYKNYKFIFNAKNIHHDLSIAEAGISNASNIFAVTYKGVKGAPFGGNNKNEGSDSDDDKGLKISVMFKDPRGNTKTIILNENKSIGTAIKRYLVKINREDFIGNEGLIFIYNQKKINYNDKRMLKDVFNGDLYPTIIVNDATDLIGA